MRGELRPAREPVLARDEELSVGDAATPVLPRLEKPPPAILDTPGFPLDLAAGLCGCGILASKTAQAFQPLCGPCMHGGAVGRPARMLKIPR
jgi:hypothetical protein